MSKISTKKVSFKGYASHLLRGVFQAGSTEKKRAVVMSHCFTCSKDYKILGWLGRNLSEKGYGILRFDFSGLGESEGSFDKSTFSTDILDLKAAVAWVQAEGYQVSGLIGHSLGGAVAIETAAQLEQVPTVAVIGTSHDPSRLTRLLKGEDWDRLETDGLAQVSIGGQYYKLTREFLIDLEKHSITATVKDWGKALLVFHATEDRLVDLDSAQKLFDKAGEPKAFFSIPGENHLYADDRSNSRAMAVIVDQWLRLNGG